MKRLNEGKIYLLVCNREEPDQLKGSESFVLLANVLLLLGLITETWLKGNPLLVSLAIGSLKYISGDFQADSPY